MLMQQPACFGWLMLIAVHHKCSIGKGGKQGSALFSSAMRDTQRADNTRTKCLVLVFGTEQRPTSASQPTLAQGTPFAHYTQTRHMPFPSSPHPTRSNSRVLLAGQGGFSRSLPRRFLGWGEVFCLLEPCLSRSRIDRHRGHCRPNRRLRRRHLVGLVVGRVPEVPLAYP